MHLSFIRKVKELIAKRNLDEGKSQVLVLDRHASHVIIDVLKNDKVNNIPQFQLTSHSPYITQPMDVCSFGVFNRQVTETLTDLP